MEKNFNFGKSQFKKYVTQLQAWGKELFHYKYKRRLMLQLTPGMYVVVNFLLSSLAYGKM